MRESIIAFDNADYEKVLKMPDNAYTLHNKWSAKVQQFLQSGDKNQLLISSQYYIRSLEKQEHPSTRHNYEIVSALLGQMQDFEEQEFLEQQQSTEESSNKGDESNDHSSQAQKSTRPLSHTLEREQKIQKLSDAEVSKISRRISELKRAQMQHQENLGTYWKNNDDFQRETQRFFWDIFWTGDKDW